MRQNIFKSTILCLGLFLTALTLCSFTGSDSPEKEQKPLPEQQTRGGGSYDYYIHAAASDEYVEMTIPDGCWFTMSMWDRYTVDGTTVRIDIGANPNEQWREFYLTFSSNCMGMDRTLLIGQDGTQYPYINGDDKG